MNKLLKNNKVRLIISVFLAIIIWVATNFSPSNEITMMVSDIPITIDLPEQAVANDLQVFQGGDITATVKVTGNRLALGSLTKSDIQVYAQQTNTITSSGVYTLAVAARKSNNAKTGFEITSLMSPSVITVNVDRSSNIEMNITNNLRFQAAEGYYTSVSLSTERVILSGPETMLNQIQKAAVDSEINGKLTDTQTLDDLPLTLYDKFGNIIDNEAINKSVSNVSATVLVLPEKVVPIVFDFPNMPRAMNIADYITKAEPDELLIAGPRNTMDTLRGITAEGPDFTTLKNEVAELELSVDTPTNCRNLSNQTVTNITLDLSSMSYTDFVVTDFNVVGLSNQYRAEVSTKSLTVRIYGPQEQLNVLTSESVSAEIEIQSQIYGTGSMEQPVKITFANEDNLCWQYGSYTANVTISAI